MLQACHAWDVSGEGWASDSGREFGILCRRVVELETWNVTIQTLTGGDAMPTVTRFEDLEAWQRARTLCNEVYAVSNKGIFSKDFGLKDQIRRASVSILSNIAEGFERSGSREFIQFLSIAKGSAGELRSQLYVALDQGYLAQRDFLRLTSLASETGKIAAGLMRYLRESAIKGTKFKAPKS